MRCKYFITQFWLLQKVCGTSDRCFIKTHRIDKEGDLQIYIFVTFRKTRHHEQPHVTSDTFIHCALSLFARRTQTAAQPSRWFRWPMFVMTTLDSQNIFCAWTWSSNQSGVGAILAFSSIVNQIFQQKEPEISVDYIYPHMKITVSNCWVLLTTKTACLI